MMAQVLTAGTLLANRFEIERLAGAGGMGAVYRAHDLLTGGPVALKLVYPPSGSQEESGRFAREAQLLSSLRHPGIVLYIAHGVTPQGARFLAMEWLDGEDLAQRLRRGPLPLPSALSLLRRVSEALAFAHERGVLHRDLKPGNIMLIKDPDVPGGERVKLLDFGIAKLQPEGGADAGLTRPGMIFGTPTYMSPEQCKGAGAVDARSDVYSLAVILFEMLAGQPPFPGEGVGVVALHLCEEPPPLESLLPTVNRAVATLVAQMLAKKREDRPSMEQVASTLRPRTVDLYQSAANLAIPYEGPLTQSVPPVQMETSASGSLPNATLGRITGQQVEPKRRLPIYASIAMGAILLVGSGSLTLWLLTGNRGAARVEKPVRWGARHRADRRHCNQRFRRQSARPHAVYAGAAKQRRRAQDPPRKGRVSAARALARSRSQRPQDRAPRAPAGGITVPGAGKRQAAGDQQAQARGRKVRQGGQARFLHLANRQAFEQCRNSSRR
jgi:serine/threonine protein kinase